MGEGHRLFLARMDFLTLAFVEDAFELEIALHPVSHTVFFFNKGLIRLVLCVYVDWEFVNF